MKKVIPNIITFISLISGAIALYQFLFGKILIGFIFIYISIALDFLDGYVARKLNAVTEFGKIFDLIVDFLIFGIILTNVMAQDKNLVLYPPNLYTILTLLVCKFYYTCHVIRIYIILVKDNNCNLGIPDTIIPIVISLAYYMNISLPIIFFICSILMVLPIRIPKFSEFQFKMR